MEDSKLHFETRAAQAGTRTRVGDTISTMPPIDPSTTFTAESVDEVHEALTPDPRGFAYSRNANPTVVSLEKVMADLEAAEDAVAFGSGMAAISSVLSSLMLEPGERIVAASVLYGVTRTAFAQLAIVGIDTDYVDVANLGEVEDAVSKPDTRVLYFETISNPLLQVADVESLALIGHRHRLAVINDNTFATPYLFRPLGAGVDIVINSATKYISGHGDVTAGIAAGNRSHMKRVRDARTVNGGILSPFEAWLALRGIRTLPIRLERQCASAFEIASWLETKTWIDRVYYPGLGGHPDRTLAARQLGDRFGAMVAFDIQGGQAEALSFIDALQLITSATSLGDAVSLVLYPPLSSHRTLTPEALAKMGIKEGLIRLSVGLESPADLTRDLERAALQSGIATSAKLLVP